MDRRCRGIGGSRRRVADDDARRTATSRGGREGAQEDAGGHREGETPAEAKSPPARLCGAGLGGCPPTYAKALRVLR